MSREPYPEISALSARAYLALFAVALVARVAILAAGPWSHPQRALVPDSARYLLLADNLRRFGTFGKAEEDGLAHRALAELRSANGTLPPADANGLRPESFRTPGYPALLALTHAAVHNLRAVLLFQCLCGAILACAVAAIARALGISVRGALLAGLLWAIHPALVVYDCIALSESLFNGAAVVALFLLTRRSFAAVALGGLFLGLASLVRPLGLLYLPMATVLLWPRADGRRFAFAVTILLSLVPAGLWACRNQAAGEGFRVSTVADVNLLYYTAGYAISEQQGEDWLQSWPARVRELSAELKQRLAPGEDVYGAARRLALEELQARPAATARVYAKALVKLALDHSMGDLCRLMGLPYEPSGLFSRLALRETASTSSAGLSPTFAATAAWMLLNLAVALGGCAGTVVALRRRAWGVLLACMVPIVLFALATGSVGLERFRLPMLVPLFILVADAVSRTSQPDQESKVV